MDTTIRNLNDDAYSALRDRAVMEGRDVGDLLNEAMSAYLERVPIEPREPTLRDLRPEALSEANERLRREIDAIVYRNWRP